MKLIDVHCHILPGVDDGAAGIAEALELLQMEQEQGVTEICLTPHLRSGMFKSTDEKIWDAYLRLQEHASEAGIDVALWLSREYYYDSDFMKRLEAGQVIHLGSQKTILTEFSYGSSVQDLLDAAQFVKQAGYQPLFAHVERYSAIQKNTDLAAELVEMGVLLQMNASSILGREGLRQRFVSGALLKQNLIHVIGSDSHDTEDRVPNLGKCADYLTKKYGKAFASKLMYHNPHALLYGEE